MTNVQIAEVFDQLGDLLEFQGANPFRVRAYRTAARTIREHTEPVSELAALGVDKLCELPGIGGDLAKKCVELVQTGQIAMLRELAEKIPPTVVEMMRVPGLGPKKAAAIFEQLHISTLEQLKEACEGGQVRGLKGFGKRTEELILQGILAAATGGARLLWTQADQVARAIAAHLRQCTAIRQLEVAGSYRRGKETVGDLDVLVVADEVQTAMDCFGAFPTLTEVIARGDTKMSVRVAGGLQIDLRIVPEESFGAALQYFTGSKEHNVVLRGLAKARGLKINEYGVYRIEGDREQYIAGRTEEEVYSALDLPCFPPEIREARQEFAWAEAGELPQLLEQNDLRGDLHMHTTASDGSASLEEMIKAACARGYSYIAITDHSQRVSMARGLDGARLRQQWAEIDAWNAEHGGDLLVLKGVECDILERGGMDLPDDVLAEADWVLASIHYGQKQARQQITERMLGAVENRWVCAIAHPTGRLLGRREAYEVDLDAVMRACLESGKLLELNANPHRLDLHDVHCAAAKRLGIPIVVNTDAHSVDQMDQMLHGVRQARRAGLTKADIANTRTWAQMKKLLGRYR